MGMFRKSSFQEKKEAQNQGEKGNGFIWVEDENMLLLPQVTGSMMVKNRKPAFSCPVRNTSWAQAMTQIHPLDLMAEKLSPCGRWNGTVCATV